MNNQPAKPEWLDFPGIEEGIRGMLFVEKTVESAKSTTKWISIKV
jgi:hypothetical protein